ncbi:hypothetical protein B0T16DRAFT_325706 [Cercophora newfieldiana]|uniref:DUF6604 domain-containing protein n=1 Tax=Cercophora newfieldiana TaxID=92897 RepID=A0AA39YDU5_9PEZI|nr:hypothetical protein B0T16DRAFT_325706 [Cercophora newfieldiana]
MGSQEAPQGIGIWHRYKLGQAQFTSWLKKTADKLSSKKPEQPEQPTPAPETPPQQSRRQKKGKAKVIPIAIDATEEKSVHWSQLEVLAQRVVDNANPDEIPDAAISILRDVVGLRKKSFKFFSGATKDSDDAKIKQSNANHAHIIGVLERVLSKLEGLVSRAPDRQPKKDSRQNTRIDVSDLSNMFAFLEVQTASDAVDGDDANASTEEEKTAPKRGKNRHAKGGKKKGDKKPHKTKKEEKQLVRVAQENTDDGSWIDRVDFGMSAVDSYDDLEDELDYYMMLYCYFEDFNAIRSYVAERWCDYWYDKSVPLCTLSTITNAAFELFHGLEVDLIRELGPRHQDMADYDFMLHCLFFELGLDHVDYHSYEDLSPEETNERIWKDEADWLAFSSWATMNKMFKMIPPGKVPHALPEQRKPPAYGANDLNSWNDFEATVTGHLFLEMCEFKAHKKNGAAPMLLPAEPELFLDIQGSLERRTYRSPVIFSLHLWVDIRNIMEEEVIHPFEQLQTSAARLKDALESHDPSKLCHNHSLKKEWSRRIWEVENFALEDFTLEHQKFIYQNLGVNEEPEAFFLLKNDPIWAGLLDFRVKLVENQLGHQFTMLSPVVEAAAYLYRAAIAADSSLPSWDMMRKCTDTYNDSSIFRIGLRDGQSAATILKNFVQVLNTYHNGTKSLEATDGGHTFTHAVNIRMSLFERYALERYEFMEYMEEITKYRLRMEQDTWEKAHSRRLASGPSSSNGECSDKTSEIAGASSALVKTSTVSTLGKLDGEREKELRRKATLSQLSATDMLQLLDDTVSSQLEGILTLNYFELFDESVALLQAMNTAFGPDLQKRVEVEDVDRPARLGSLPTFLSQDLEEAVGTEREREIIRTVVDIVRAHLSDRAGAVAVQPS